MSIVRVNPSAHRYEIYDGDQRAGYSQYELTGSRIAITHTEIGEAFAGRGLARTLVTDLLADAARRGLAVLPFCPYVRKVIAQNLDQYLDLVPASDRKRFGLPADAGPGRDDLTEGGISPVSPRSETAT